jgi:hypothetical protein
MPSIIVEEVTPLVLSYVGASSQEKLENVQLWKPVQLNGAKTPVVVITEAEPVPMIVTLSNVAVTVLVKTYSPAKTYNSPPVAGRATRAEVNSTSSSVPSHT